MDAAPSAVRLAPTLALVESTPIAHPLVWLTCTTDSRYVRRAVDAQWRRLLVRPRMVVAEVFVALLLVLALVAPEVRGTALVVAAVLVGGVLLAYVKALVGSARRVPAGTQLKVALDGDRLVGEGKAGTTSVRLAAFRRVIVGRHVVLLENRTNSYLAAYPREMFPDGVLEDLRNRIEGASPEAPATTTAPAARPRPGALASYTTGPGYVDRVVSAYVSEVVFAPRRVLVQVLIAVGLFVTGVVLTGGGTAGVVAGLVYVGLGGSVVAWSMWRQRNRFARVLTGQVPVGSTFRAALLSDGVWVEGPAVTGETSYAAYRSVSVRDELVFLRARDTPLYWIYPAQLFPGAALDLLRERIGAAGSATSARKAQTPPSTR